MLFLYDTKHGATEVIINNIINGIHEIKPDVNILKFKKKYNDVEFNQDNFICICSPMYFRAPLQSIIKLIKNHHDMLKNKKVFFILVGMKYMKKDIINNTYFQMNGEEKIEIIKQFSELTKLPKVVFEGFERN